MHYFYRNIVGAHTGQNIKDNFDSILLEFEIVDKTKHVISDNASNMAKAFKVTFPLPEDVESESDEDELDIENGEDDLSSDLELETHVSELTHLRCFAHSIQLTVKDGLREAGVLTLILGKCCKLSSLLHTSTKFKVIIL